ncbi:ATP-binding cassette domain-containing protein [Shewanella aestuarii]|uniref:ATP-binding cassette domain-containing protein n=1 Tax=Shewanella aestuarii TaxID=1028752 RepID=A0A6G9QPC8_9GAMM|nr:ATP-binding cassette domain-containing protein [Shewanella aestuarii]QIR15907.1 ATP-binding cassette domain-containing protein [Shewanella aestuarii]
MQICFKQFSAATAKLTLEINDWQIESADSWALFSTDGDIGAILTPLLMSGETEQVAELSITGQLTKSRAKVVEVSLNSQQRLLEQVLELDDNEHIAPQDSHVSVFGLIFEQCHDQNLTQRLLTELDLVHLQHSYFTQLSTGESRRLMLARALAEGADLLVLDDPFAGLDVEHRKSLALYLEQLSRSMQLLMIVSREEDIPVWIDHVGLFSHGKLESVMSKADWDKHPVIAQIKAQSQEQSEQMMALLKRHRHQAKFDNPLFEIKHGKVAYSDKTIFTEVNWRIDNGQHWQVKGPNGCGKSTLLGLIFGDHPQCYSNDIHIFGKKRGTGETIWEIKKNIGMVSSALHLQYRVNCSALDVIVSGFHDSIGLYQQPTAQERKIASEWLNILHMSQFAKTSFRQLDYGQQRLLLIARAIVKQPTLLILDEPYQGLDYLGRRLMKNTLELIAKEHLSQLLYVSHYHEDSLPSIGRYLTFVPGEPQQGYQAVISYDDGFSPD